MNSEQSDWRTSSTPFIARNEDFHKRHKWWQVNKAALHLWSEMCIWKTRVRCSALLGRFYTKDWELQRWCEELTHVKLLRQSLVARHSANLFNSRGPEKNKSCCLHTIDEVFMDYFNKDLLRLAIAFSHPHNVTKQTTQPTRRSMRSTPPSWILLYITVYDKLYFRS